jgi:hypothetical protein
MSTAGFLACGDSCRVDLQQLEQQLQQQQQQQASQAAASGSTGLLSHMQAVFDGGGVANSSLYMAPVLMFPGLTRLWQWLAYRCPDRKLRILAKVRFHTCSCCSVCAWAHLCTIPHNTAC